MGGVRVGPDWSVSVPQGRNSSKAGTRDSCETAPCRCKSSRKGWVAQLSSAARWTTNGPSWRLCTPSQHATHQAASSHSHSTC